jgi:hypothetical protein
MVVSTSDQATTFLALADLNRKMLRLRRVYISIVSREKLSM